MTQEIVSDGRCRGTLGEIGQKVTEYQKDNFDETLPLSMMHFNSLTEMEISGQKISVLPTAQRSLTSRFKLDMSYLQRCPAYLQAENLNYWLGKEQDKRDTFFCRFRNKGGLKLRAALTERYQEINNVEIMEKLFKRYSPYQKCLYRISDETFSVSIPDRAMAFDVGGKEMWGGLSFGNSEVGLWSFIVEAFLYILVCTNGMMRRSTVYGSRFRHISRWAIEHFDEVYARAEVESRDFPLLVQRATDVEVEDPFAMMQDLNKKYNLSKKEGCMVECAWEKEPEFNQMGVINAYTRAAHEGNLSNERALRFEQVGGEILQLAA
jgi:hypothetical protein